MAAKVEDTQTGSLATMLDELNINEGSQAKAAPSIDLGERIGPVGGEATIFQEDDTGSDSSSNALSTTAQSFRALGKIINFMRRRYQSGTGVEPLQFEEILEHTKQTELSPQIREWLVKEGLCNNKRIEVVDNSEAGKYYHFKPAYKLQNIDDLIALLKDHDRRGLGGLLMDDIRDSLPNYRQVLRDSDSRLLVLKRPLDRKSIVYYIDHEQPTATDIELQAMWRSLGLEDIQEANEPSDDNSEHH